MNNPQVFRNWREYLWYYASLILWIIIIFVASSNTGSISNTSLIIRPLFLWLVPDISETSLLIVHGYVRKLAHLVFYFILGMLAARAVAFTFENYRRKFLFMSAFVLVFSIAALDETNQSFLVSRTSSLYDVLLDTAGGLAAITVWFVGAKPRKADS